MQALSDAQKYVDWRETNLWLVGFFYFFQGFYFFGSGIYLAAAMAGWGVPSGTQATVIMIISLPFYLQVFPALLSDRVPVGRWGRRKPYILIGGLIYVPGFWMMIAVQQFNAWWLGGLLVTLLAWSLVDTALDALIIDITPRQQLTRMQSASRGSRLAGMALTGLFMPIIGPRIGWTSVLWGLCLIALLQSGAALLLPEKPFTRQMLKQSEPVAKILKSIVGQPAFWATMGFAFFLYAGLGFVSLINVYLLTELGWGRDPGLMQAYGVTNLLERLGGVLGALLVMRIPNHYLTSTRFYALAILAFWVLTAPWLLVMRQPEQVGLAYLARATEGMGAGIISTLFLALIMRLSQPSLEGFTFNLLGTAASLGERVLGTNLVAFMAVPLGGLAPAFFTLIPFSLVSLVFLAPILKLLRANASLAPQAAPEPGFSG